MPIVDVIQTRDRRRDGVVAGCTFGLGVLTVALLTRYNLTFCCVWSVGAIRPNYTFEEYLLVNIAGLVFFPFLLIFALRESVESFGFRAPEPGASRIALLLFAVMVPAIIVASRRPEFQSYYPIQPQAAYVWRYFVYFELVYGFYLFCWEFFYRGFLTFGLSRFTGQVMAIALQAVAFGLMHYGKPTPEFIGSFIAGGALGWLAIRARSFLPGFYLHWAVAFIFDVLAIHAKRGGIF